MKKHTEKYVLLHTTKNTYRSNLKTKYIGYFTYDNAINCIVEKENLFDKNRAENGRFCKKYYNDECGNRIAEYGDFKFDIDGWYNMYRILTIKQLDINDWLDIFETEVPFELLDVADNAIIEQIELELRNTPYYDNIMEFIAAKQQ